MQESKWNREEKTDLAKAKTYRINYPKAPPHNQ